MLDTKISLAKSLTMFPKMTQENVEKLMVSLSLVIKSIACGNDSQLFHEEQVVSSELSFIFYQVLNSVPDLSKS